jgi:hypothetical protein
MTTDPQTSASFPLKDNGRNAMNRTGIAAAVTTAAAAVTLALPITGAQATGCSVTWGSLAKSVSGPTQPTLPGGVRAGRHECYDRLVIDLGGAGYRVRYVSAVRDQGRGAVVPLRGGAFLQIDFRSRDLPRPAMPNVAGFTTFRQVGWGGSFEGYTTIGLGVRARLPFRVFAWSDHLVIDVAHHW